MIDIPNHYTLGFDHDRHIESFSPGIKRRACLAPYKLSEYGAVAKEPSHIRLYRAANLTTTYFEDLTIFWGKGVSEPRHLIDALVPGSTITLVQPSDAHKPWMAYYDMTHGCDAIMEEVVDRFNVSSVWKNRDPNVAVEIIGIESPK